MDETSIREFIHSLPEQSCRYWTFGLDLPSDAIPSNELLSPIDFDSMDDFRTSLESASGAVGLTTTLSARSPWTEKAELDATQCDFDTYGGESYGIECGQISLTDPRHSSLRFSMSERGTYVVDLSLRTTSQSSLVLIDGYKHRAIEGVSARVMKSDIFKLTCWQDRLTFKFTIADRDRPEITFRFKDAGSSVDFYWAKFTRLPDTYATTDRIEDRGSA